MKRQSVSPLKGRSVRPTLRSLKPATRTIQCAGAVVVLVAAFAGCSTPDPQAIDYQSTSRQAKKAPSLAVPPDLLTEQHARLDVPSGGNASLSGYQASPGTPATVQAVLPTTKGLHIERDGNQSWLVVSDIPPDQLWERIRSFWQQQGFVLTEDSRQRGVMQTDWLESHANVDQGLIRNTLSWATDNSYVTGERNRFRTRLEAGPNGSVYVFVSQQGLHEILTGSSNDNAQWAPKPNDPGMEAEYLRRLQQVLASGPQRPAYGPESEPAPAPRPVAATPGAQEAVPSARLPSGIMPTEDGILLSQDYDHAWQRVGQALDRGNFTVDGRNRDTGIYSLRYVDPNDLGTAAQGFWNQLFHGKKEKVAHQFELNVRAITPDSTRLAILDGTGKPDNSPLAQRIMRLLVSEL